MLRLRAHIAGFPKHPGAHTAESHAKQTGLPIQYPPRAMSRAGSSVRDQSRSHQGSDARSQTPSASRNGAVPIGFGGRVQHNVSIAYGRLALLTSVQPQTMYAQSNNSTTSIVNKDRQLRRQASHSSMDSAIHVSSRTSSRSGSIVAHTVPQGFGDSGRKHYADSAYGTEYASGNESSRSVHRTRTRVR